MKNMAQTSPQVQTDTLYDMYGKIDTKKNTKGLGVHVCIYVLYIYM